MQNLQSLSDWLDWQEKLHPATIELGLERVKRVWQRLHPEPFNPFVISVAGTNGKGSCVAFLDAILSAATYSVGTYTSPHLIRYNERIHLFGKQADDEQLISAFQRIEEVRDDIQLTYFEYGTLAALYLFASEKVDVAVLEVGLGGRLDAVNILDADAALITSIGFDHMQWLGDDLDKIAYEKAGILRTGRPAVFAEPGPPAGFVSAAESSGAIVSYAGADYSWEIADHSWSVNINPENFSALPLPFLQGSHQLQNAAAVITLLHSVADQLTVSSEAISKGLANARLAGRFQVIKGVPNLVLDVAHNSESAQVLAGNLSKFGETGKKYAIFSMYADKPVEKVVQILADKFDHWFLYPLDSERGMNRADIEKRVVHELAAGNSTILSSLQDAWQHGCLKCEAGDSLVFFGSFEVIGNVLKLIEQGFVCNIKKAKQSAVASL
jgi:dihydrofolate synthase/folylpolyglutamate synthase